MQQVFTYSPYTLKRKDNSSKREGALLRVEFNDGLIGYADCHPWPEFGDAPLDQQLKLLQANITTRLTERSLHFARLDAEARAEKRSLFEGLTIPQSHTLMPNLSSYVKIKLGESDFPSLKQFFVTHPEVKVRLDFNLKLSQERFECFLKEIEPWFEQIDFCEDPFAGSEESWKEIQNRYGVSLASDFHRCASADVIVIKPAIQELFSSRKRVIVTSYLDHPLGQLAAAYTAAHLVNPEVCGLLSHTVYEPNAFSKQLEVKDERLISPLGTGFGFDALLYACKWRL